MPRAVLPLAILIACSGPAGADPQKPDAEKLLGRLRTTYSQATYFSPAAMRYALRKDPLGDLDQARSAAAEAPGDAGLRFAAAVAAETAEDPTAPYQWQVALALIEAQVKSAAQAVKGNKKPAVDPVLLERHVEALVGADVAVRAVPAAEKLLAARPDAWRSRLLAGDAYLRRADFNWRVVVRKAAGTTNVSGPELIQMNADLEAAGKAYDTALGMAPSEPAPRGARIALRLALPFMASFLPEGAVRAPRQPDLTGVRADLLEAVQLNPGRIAPLWHALHFFSAPSAGEVSLKEGERAALAAALAKVQPAGDDRLFTEEARGLLAVIGQDWSAARQAFEAALLLAPDRRFAAEWLGVAESNSKEPRGDVLARVRKRLGAKPRTQDYALLGLLLGEEDRSAAIEALRKAISLDVANANARYNLALLLLRQNPDSVEAGHHLKRFLELRADDREGRLAYAVFLALGGSPNEARRTLESLLKLYELDENLKTRIGATLQDLPAPSLPAECSVSLGG